MVKKYFPLGASESNKLTMIMKILFGLVCLSVATYWMIFNVKAEKSAGGIWATIIFLLGFGFYMIWAGLGYANKFIEIGSDYIRLKKNPFFPVIMIPGPLLKKIDFFPLSVIFFLGSGEKILLRFGTTYYETNKEITDEIISFAESNNITFEIIEEEI